MSTARASRPWEHRALPAPNVLPPTKHPTDSRGVTPVRAAAQTHLLQRSRLSISPIPPTRASSSPAPTPRDALACSVSLQKPGTSEETACGALLRAPNPEVTRAQPSDFQTHLCLFPSIKVCGRGSADTLQHLGLISAPLLSSESTEGVMRARCSAPAIHHKWSGLQ